MDTVEEKAALGATAEAGIVKGSEVSLFFFFFF